MNSFRALRPGLCASPSAPCLSTTVRYLRTRTGAAPAAAGLSESERIRLRTIESMPFQTYQMALDYIKKDRAEKLAAIKEQQARIAEVVKQGGTNDRTLHSMNEHLDWLMVQADINNPRVKYNFDRGVVDMNKPVYRFLMNRKWREYRRPLLMQRLEQMHIFPDIVPHLDPIVDVPVRFRGYDVQPGTIVHSEVSENHPTLKVIPFQKKRMLCTVLVVDPDVPNVEKNGFDYRLHWLVSNIPITHTHTQAIGTGAKRSDTIVPWLPPHALKGEPYHRLGLLVFEQSGFIDPKKLGEIKRDGFNTRSFMAKQKMDIIGAYMFRTQWDSATKEIMQKHNLPGWDKMFVRAKD